MKGNIEAQGWGMYDFGYMPNSFLVNELPIPPGNFIPEAVNPVCHSFGWNKQHVAIAENDPSRDERSSEDASSGMVFFAAKPCEVSRVPGECDGLLGPDSRGCAVGETAWRPS